MTNEELSFAVFEKMSEEMKEFADYLKRQNPETILNHASEYVVKAEMLSVMEYTVLSAEQARALLSSDCPLNAVYLLYDEWSPDIPENLGNAIFEKADKLVAVNKENCDVPVYPHSAAQAQQDGMIETYQLSHDLNLQCRYTIERAIMDFYKDNRLDDEAVRLVVDQYGLARTKFVLASTVQNHSWDGRYFPDNKSWAQTVGVKPDLDDHGVDRRFQYSVDVHPGLVDLFTTMLRREYCQEQNQEKKPQRVKPSVREKLTAPSPKKNAPKHSAHSKGKER